MRSSLVKVRLYKKRVGWKIGGNTHRGEATHKSKHNDQVKNPPILCFKLLCSLSSSSNSCDIFIIGLYGENRSNI